MIRIRQLLTVLLAIGLVDGVDALDAVPVLSGTVLGMDRSPRAGVMVTLKGSGFSTTTDDQGRWSIGATNVGMRQRRAEVGSAGRIFLRDGRLQVVNHGRDLSGRKLGVFQSVFPTVPALRGLAAPDTLTYSTGGTVWIRDTVSGSLAGIVRVLDTTLNPAIVHGYLEDVRDGRVYRTVKIFNQTWMAENLDFHGAGMDSGWWYANNPEYGLRLGRLYDWAAAMGLVDSCNFKTCVKLVDAKHRGICPVGWHVPTSKEWDTLLIAVGGYDVAGLKLKATSGWSFPRWNSDEYGFHVIPGGYRATNGSFFGADSSNRSHAYFWSASWYIADYGRYRYTSYGGDDVTGGDIWKTSAFSLRCIED